MAPFNSSSSSYLGPCETFFFVQEVGLQSALSEDVDEALDGGVEATIDKEDDVFVIDVGAKASAGASARASILKAQDSFMLDDVFGFWNKGSFR
mmetsp:Transcript_19904/g.30636  ORF Transcript_19904/g.30636 Transcript_19904/m.30636 type:complete len:94 (+) Transcript_19904:1105-1386(+)